jgi:hypothetical protein|eukprot:COSAG01_NODE_97_length_26660_cov_100.642935_8_plen_73_part_00
MKDIGALVGEESRSDSELSLPLRHHLNNGSNGGVFWFLGDPVAEGAIWSGFLGSNRTDSDLRGGILGEWRYN